MPTALVTVKVTRLEAGQGFRITCDSPLCTSWRPVRGMRAAADVLAHGHRASHQTPTPEED